MRTMLGVTLRGCDTQYRRKTLDGTRILERVRLISVLLQPHQRQANACRSFNVTAAAFCTSVVCCFEGAIIAYIRSIRIEVKMSSYFSKINALIAA